jgi:hypothetical protein
MRRPLLRPERDDHGTTYTSLSASPATEGRHESVAVASVHTSGVVLRRYRTSGRDLSPALDLDVRILKTALACVIIKPGEAVVRQVAAASFSSQTVPCFSIAHITRTRKWSVAASVIFFYCRSPRWERSRKPWTVGKRPNPTAIEVCACACELRTPKHSRTLPDWSRYCAAKSLIYLLSGLFRCPSNMGKTLPSCPEADHDF